MTDELISKQTALDVLDILIADSARIAGDSKLVQKTVNIQRAMRNIIAKLPAVDAVPVVRCRDCKHLSHLQGAKDDAHVCALGWGLRGIVAEEDFCSYGKRREENAAD